MVRLHVQADNALLDEDAPRAGEKFRLADSKGGSDNGNDNDNDTRELAEELATLGEEERQALVASMMAQMMRGSGAVGANNVGGTVRANNVGDAVGQPSDMDNESDNPATMLAALLKQRDAVPDVPLHTIQPRPGFVIKTAVRVDRKSSNSSSVDRSADNDSDNVSAFKLFINICQSDEVPAPPPATDTEVQRAVDALLLEGNGAEDDTGPVAVTYRVPLSLSTVRDDVDKAGNTCRVIDACVHTTVVERCMHSDKYRAFIVELAMEWVEQRYREHIVVDQDLGEKMDGGAWLLCRDYTLPKMHVKGKLTEHRIRRVKRPAVEVVGETTTGASPVHRSQTEDGGIMPQQVTAESPSTTTLDATAAEAVEVQPSPPPHASITPCHTLVAESSASAFRADDHSPGALPPEYYVLTVELPGVSTTANDAATLDVERNRVILRARTTTTATTPAVFELDLALRWPVDLDQIGAQLHRGTGELTVTMCVDVARAFSMAAHAGGSGESEISATPEAVSV